MKLDCGKHLIMNGPWAAAWNRAEQLAHHTALRTVWLPVRISVTSQLQESLVTAMARGGDSHAP